MSKRKPSDLLNTSVPKGKVRTLVVVLGDQLDQDSPAFEGFDPKADAIFMAEVVRESRHVPSHVQRTTMFLSAMRHFALEQIRLGRSVWYVTLIDPKNTQRLDTELARAIQELSPKRVRMVTPGDHRLRASLRAAAGGTPFEEVADSHFLASSEQFRGWAKGRTQLVMEYFYREQRRRLKVLVDEEGDPIGGVWNFDKDNRESFGKQGPGKVRLPTRFEPDDITREVMGDVRRALPTNPGTLDSFGWPVTRAQALEALEDFVKHRLAKFGAHEDAMWTGEPWLFHSQLSPPLNLKLLRPEECVDAALRAFQKGLAPIESVEGFVRQVIGWREFIRGVYDLEGPGYAERNWLGQHGRLPDFYWHGQTDMKCMQACIGQVVEYGYAHHIQRLMVTGNFALTSGVHPLEISDWYLGMFVDGVDWVTLPNTLGMVMHADGTASKGPVVGSKPYAASGQYIKRMSNYCQGCRFSPEKRTGPDACPFTVFYWDFLNRHRRRFERNPRVGTIIKNLDRFGAEQVTQITVSARSLRDKFGIGDIDKPRKATDYGNWRPPEAPSGQPEILFEAR